MAIKGLLSFSRHTYKILFNVGVEHSMTPIGEKVGSGITKSKKLFLVILMSFGMGLAITISEPDLQVLAT